MQDNKEPSIHHFIHFLSEQCQSPIDLNINILGFATQNKCKTKRFYDS